jgi:hypothetical protein
MALLSLGGDLPRSDNPLFDAGSEHFGADNSTMVVGYMTDRVAERLGVAVIGV